jgi:3-oxoacyl-[acyl-carrier protein] reductase
MTAQRVAKTFIDGLKRDRTEILVGWQSHMAIWCQRFAPWLLNRILVIAMPQLA